MDYAYFNRSDLKSNENKSIFLNIHESMYRENEYGIDDDRKTNNINENYMSVKYLHYRNNSMISHIRNLNKSKSSKNYNSNIIINHERSLSASNGMSLGPNQAFWEASIYAKYRKHLKKNNNKIILSKPKYSVNPSTNIRTNNNSVVVQSNNDNFLTSNNIDFQNSKVTETFMKNNFDNSSVNKKNFSFNIKI